MNPFVAIAIWCACALLARWVADRAHQPRHDLEPVVEAITPEVLKTWRDVDWGTPWSPPGGAR